MTIRQVRWRCRPERRWPRRAPVRRRWRRGEDLVHHILDPRTGRSADPVWRTVSVAAQTCFAANTVSTAAIVRGWRALDWIAALGMPARLVDSDRIVHTVGGWPSPEPGEPAMTDEALWALGRGTGITALAFLTVSLALGIATRSGRSACSCCPGSPSPTSTASPHWPARCLSCCTWRCCSSTPTPSCGSIDFVVPFLGAYRPLWQGLGTLAFDVLRRGDPTQRAAPPHRCTDLPRRALGDLRVVADRPGARARQRYRCRPHDGFWRSPPAVR